ncbi:DNA sulfur modification protein DndD [Bacillus salitolerans]|uniref:Nuclease SbcCD subunit C n=1 Tax=Bacillus salitolerans TaxID=1437434 RepID=A0ABW4LWE2_9BACI
MIINEIQLTNIGAYKGNHKFDFRPNQDKNVILIGGENGAGKTTLLNAIKLGLFGAYGYGYKTENTEYFKRINSFLNNSTKKSNENDYKIKINFTLTEDLEQVDYTLIRHWSLKGTSIKESFEVIANKRHLSEYDKELFQTKLKEIMPPQLLELCLFDGEEIARIVNENLLSDYLNTLSRVVFNLDLFETLENDLETYANQSIDPQKMESIEKELFELNNRDKEIRALIFSSSNKIKHLEENRSNLSDEYSQLKQDFEQYGGLVKSERDLIIQEMHNIELLRKQNQEKIREFVANLLPFYLTRKLLSETREQIKNEESLQLFKQLDQKLSDETMKNIIQLTSSSLDTKLSTELREQFLKVMQPKSEIYQIHGASNSESGLIENIYFKLSNNYNLESLSLIEENKKKLMAHQELREKLNVHDSSNEFTEMIQRMEKNQTLIVEIDIELNNEQLHLDELKIELDELTTSIDKIQSILKDNEKTKSSFLESQKIISLSRRFREIQLKKKLQQVQIEASTMIKRILRKHNYISSILIDNDTYNVILLDSQKDQIEKATLSAGEKQILLISIIWSIFKCSGRKVPFIFDTLLGRLDKTHKNALLTEFIPNCGRQAIILSTDTEIDKDHYELLASHVAKQYMLEFNVERKETNIINKYFSFSDMEMSK